MKVLKKKLSLIILALLFVVCCGTTIALSNINKEKVSAQSATVTFVGVRDGQNYDGWVGSHAFTATFLVFDGPTFAAGQYVTNGNKVIDGIYYESPAYNGRKRFDFVWIEAERLDGAKNNQAGLNVIELLNNATNTIADGSVLHVVPGTSLGGQILPEITLKLIGNQWVEYKAPTVSFTGMASSYNHGYYPWGDNAYRAEVLEFDKPLYTSGATANIAVSYPALGSGMKINGVAISSVLNPNITFNVLGNKGAIEIYYDKTLFPTIDGTTKSIVLTIDEGTRFLDQVLPQVTLEFDGTKWVEVPKVDVSSTPWFNAPYGDGGQYGIGLTTGAYNLTTQQFCNFSGFLINNKNIGSGILWAEGQILPLFDQATHLVGGVNGYDYPTFEIKDGAKAVGSSDSLTVYFKPLTLYYINGAWTPNYTPVEFTDIATPWFHQAYASDYGLGLRLNTLYSASATNLSLTSYSGITYNGGALSDIKNWNAPAQGCGQTGILFVMPIDNGAPKLTNGYDYPTLDIAEGAVITLASGETFHLAPATYYFDNGSWTDIDPSTLAFTGMSSSYNHGIYPFGGGVYNAEVLEFSKPLYTEKLSTANMASYSALGNGMKINGTAITAVLSPNITFNVLGNKGAIEFYYDKTLFPTFSATTRSIVLTIDEGTSFLGNELPAVTLYFNGTNWQLEPYEIPLAELSGVSSSYNNGQNPWRDDYYLTAFEFNKVLSVAGVNDSTTSTLGDKLKLNGTSVNSLGWLLSAPGNGTGMNVQSPKSSIPTLSATTRQVKLELSEAVLFGDVAINPFTLYLNPQGKWQTEAYEIPLVNWASVSSTYNNEQNPWRTDYYLTAFTFSGVLSVAGVGDSSTTALGDKLKINGTSVNSLGWLLSAPGNGNGMNLQAPKSSIPTLCPTTTQVKLELTEAVLFGDVAIDPFTLYLNESNKWQAEEYTKVYTNVTYDSMTWNQSTVFNNSHYYNVLKFSNKLYADATSGNAVLATIMNSIKLNGNPIANLVMTPDNDGNLGFQIPFANMLSFSNSVKQIVLTIEEDTVCGNCILPEVTLYFNGTNWQTTEYSVSDASFIGIASNMGASPWGANQRLLILSFSKPIAPISTSIQGADCGGALNGNGNIRSKITLNGNPFTENVLFYVNTFYNVGTESNAVELLFTNYGSALTFKNGDVLHIPQGTHIGDVVLGEVVLTFNGTIWDYEAAENPLDKLEWNDNGYNAYVDEHTILLRYSTQINGTANEEDIDIKANLEGFLTINGVDITAIEGAEVIIPGGYGGIFILIRGIDDYRVDGYVFELKEVNVFKSKLPALTLTYNTSFGTDESKWCYPVTFSMNGAVNTAYVGADTNIVVTSEVLRNLFNTNVNVSFGSYTIGATNYEPSETVLITAPTAVTINDAILFGTEKGAAIRIDSDYKVSGIRFETRINYNLYNAYINEYDQVITGTYIFPRNKLDEYDGTLYQYLTDSKNSVANKNYVDIVNNGFINRATAESDGYFKYFGSLVNILDNNFARDFIGVGYLKLVKDSTTTIILGSDDQSPRSIYEIAKKAYIDTSTGSLTDGDKIIIRNHYIEKVVEINGTKSFAPIAKYTELNDVLAYSPVNYGLDYDANGVFTISAVGKICAVIVDGVNLGSINAGSTKYLAYYDGKELVDVKPNAALKFGIGEPTQELWGKLGSSNWSADSKSASMWGTDQVNAYSTAENIATVNSAFSGNSARIWMHTDELCEPVSNADEKYLKPGALAVVKEVIADFKAKGVTNIAFQVGLITPMYAKTFYNTTEDAWYSFWDIVGEEHKTGDPYKGVATLPGDDGSVSGMSYDEFLCIQEEFYNQLLEEIGDSITCIEILNEIELCKLMFRAGVEATKKNDISRLNGLTVDTVAQVVMDVCFRASKAVKASGKNVKILMPSLACVDGNAIDPSKSSGLGFNTVELFTAEYNYIKFYGLANNGSDRPDDYFQFINMHPYVMLSQGTSTTNYLYDNNSTRQTTQQIADRWTAYINSLRQIAVDNGDGDKPIWITEFGMADYCQGGISGQKWQDYNTNKVTLQTEVFTTIINIIKKSMPCFDSFIFFRLGDYAVTSPDYATGGEATYGIIDKDGNLKDIGKNLYTILTGSTDYSGIISAVAGIKG